MPRDGAKDRSRAFWGATPAGWVHAADAEPGTAAFFRPAYERRSTSELPFLDRLVDFEGHRSLDVLELGCGAGFDAFSFCRAGARYTGIDLVPENLRRTRAHLALDGLTASLATADAEVLPFPDGSFDAVYSFGVLHHTPDTDASFREAFRVLRPGGRFIVALYNRRSAFHWISLVLWNWILLGGWLRRSYQQQLSLAETGGAGGEGPLVKLHTRPQIRRMLEDAGFHVERSVVRKLKDEDLPPVLNRLPRRLLDRLGHAVGWYVFAFGRKPGAP